MNELLLHGSIYKESPAMAAMKSSIGVEWSTTVAVENQILTKDTAFLGLLVDAPPEFDIINGDLSDLRSKFSDTTSRNTKKIVQPMVGNDFVKNDAKPVNNNSGDMKQRIESNILDMKKDVSDNKTLSGTQSSRKKVDEFLKFGGNKNNDKS